jgi:hypothetical protein
MSARHLINQLIQLSPADFEAVVAHIVADIGLSPEQISGMRFDEAKSAVILEKNRKPTLRIL